MVHWCTQRSHCPRNVDQWINIGHADQPKTDPLAAFWVHAMMLMVQFMGERLELFSQGAVKFRIRGADRPRHGDDAGLASGLVLPQFLDTFVYPLNMFFCKAVGISTVLGRAVMFIKPSTDNLDGQTGYPSISLVVGPPLSIGVEQPLHQCWG